MYEIKSTARTGLLHLGIDPGANTGLAVYAPRINQITHLRTEPFWEAHDLVLGLAAPEHMVVVLEDPTFTTYVWQANRKDTVNVKLKKAQSVGANKRDAQLWFDLLSNKGYHVITKAPGEGRGWDSAKWTEDLFQRITGCMMRSSQHARDAAAMVYGMNGRIDVYRRTQPMERPTL